jgi:hypothetical protein
MSEKSADPDETFDLVHFPDLICTTDDAPVALSPLLAVGPGNAAISGLRISRVNDIVVDGLACGELPGIRVGSGDGSGYIVRRQSDSQLLFVPDAGFTGLTAFRYTVADNEGGEATLVATVSVQPDPAPSEHTMSFADGTRSVSVPAGVSGAILGAIAYSKQELGSGAGILVFEDGATETSARFGIQNGMLRLTEPIEPDGTNHVIHLSLVAASDDGAEISRAEFDVEVIDVAADQFVFRDMQSIDTGGGDVTAADFQLARKAGTGAEQLTHDEEVSPVDLQVDADPLQTGGASAADDSDLF